MVRKKRHKQNIFYVKIVLIFALIIAFILLALLIKDWQIVLINNSVNQAIQKIQVSFFIEVSKIISYIFEVVGVILITIAFCVYLFLTKRRKESIIYALTVILSSISVTLLKNVFTIARPINALLNETDYAFPSGHTSIAVVLFGLFAYFQTRKSGKNKTLIILGSILGIIVVAFCRLYLSVHWFTDILGGLIVGSIWLIFASYICEKLSSKK